VGGAYWAKPARCLAGRGYNIHRNRAKLVQRAEDHPEGDEAEDGAHEDKKKSGSLSDPPEAGCPLGASIRGPVALASKAFTGVRGKATGVGVNGCGEDCGGG